MNSFSSLVLAAFSHSPSCFLLLLLLLLSSFLFLPLFLFLFPLFSFHFLLHNTVDDVNTSDVVVVYSPNVEFLHQTIKKNEFLNSAVKIVDTDNDLKNSKKKKKKKKNEQLEKEIEFLQFLEDLDKK